MWFPHRQDSRVANVLFWLYSGLVLVLLVLNANVLAAQLGVWSVSMFIRYRYSAAGRMIRGRTYALIDNHPCRGGTVGV